MEESKENEDKESIEIVERPNNSVRYDEDTKDEVMMMHSRGWSYPKIAQRDC